MVEYKHKLRLSNNNALKELNKEGRTKERVKENPKINQSVSTSRNRADANLVKNATFTTPLSTRRVGDATYAGVLSIRWLDVQGLGPIIKEELNNNRNNDINKLSPMEEKAREENQKEKNQKGRR